MPAHTQQNKVQNERLIDVKLKFGLRNQKRFFPPMTLSKQAIFVLTYAFECCLIR